MGLISVVAHVLLAELVRLRFGSVIEDSAEVARLRKELISFSLLVYGGL
jgi:hypothetical protein